MTALSLLWFGIGLAVGAALAWLAVRARAEGRVLAAEARADALERLGAFQQTLSDDFDGRHKAIEELVGPLVTQLAGYREQTEALEKARLGDLGQVKDHLTRLTNNTQQIAGALRSTHTRGRWGEITLRRSAELAGLSAHCDFSEQRSSDGGRMRPDMEVHLPGGREIVIDAKVPLDGYLEAIEADSDAERARHMGRHAAAVRRHVDVLASREYQAKLTDALDFVVLFLPHDALLAGACEQQNDLVEYAFGKHVVFATPTTLFALLKSVAHGWREEQLATNAREILSVAQEMQDRLVIFAQHFAKLGVSLGRAVGSFNDAVGSFQSRVLPQARRIREMGAPGSKQLPEVEAVDVHPRTSDRDRPELTN